MVAGASDRALGVQMLYLVRIGAFVPLSCVFIRLFWHPDGKQVHVLYMRRVRPRFGGTSTHVSTTPASGGRNICELSLP